MTDDEESMEELAIIKNIHIGMRDCSTPVIWFETHMLYGAALQIVEDIKGFIGETQCYQLEDLNNKPCVVVRKNGLIRYSRIKND